MPIVISIIIPVFREKGINVIIRELRYFLKDEKAEVIIVDCETGCIVIRDVKGSCITRGTLEKGRSCQMNNGALNAKGKVLLFLHADTSLPEETLDLVRECLKDPKIAGGAFDLEFKSDKLFFKIIGKCASIRSRISRIPFGDQAIFIRKTVFEKLGGYRYLPIMEDVDLMKRLKKESYTIKLLKPAVKTSPRRWEENGYFRTTFLNIIIQVLFRFGFSPHMLARLYYGKQYSSI